MFSGAKRCFFAAAVELLLDKMFKANFRLSFDFIGVVIAGCRNSNNNNVGSSSKSELHQDNFQVEVK